LKEKENDANRRPPSDADLRQTAEKIKGEVVSPRKEMAKQASERGA